MVEARMHEQNEILPHYPRALEEVRRISAELLISASAV